MQSLKSCYFPLLRHSPDGRVLSHWSYYSSAGECAKLTVPHVLGRTYPPVLADVMSHFFELFVSCFCTQNMQKPKITRVLSGISIFAKFCFQTPTNTIHYIELLKSPQF